MAESLTRPRSRTRKFGLTRSKVFRILSATQALLALAILANEVMAIYNRVPGGNFPMEHRDSWFRVSVFCAGAIANLFVIWLVAKRRETSHLPSPLSALLLGILVAFVSPLFAHYLSTIGWCCEQPFAFHFGFPFSHLLGIGSFSYPELQLFENYGFLQILVSSEPQVHWRFLPYRFFLNGLFWSDVAFSFLGVLKCRLKSKGLHEG